MFFFRPVPPNIFAEHTAVTMDFYAHLQKQTAAKAARHIDAVFG